MKLLLRSWIAIGALCLVAATANAAAPMTRDQLITAQVILDRARFSPGVIDGRDGANFGRALRAYEIDRKIAGPTNGGLAILDDATLKTLIAADGAPVTEDHVITAEEVKGPFLGALPAGMLAQSKLPALSYVSPLQALAARFHMDEALLTALNPGADFAKAGTHIKVAVPSTAPLPPVTRVEVDKANDQVRAFDGAGHVVATFPATVGSTERPAPSGQFAVRFSVANPDYTYDPKRLTFGKTSQGKLTLKPGPNNPVGSTWIDLTIDTYGIHGTPDPRMVGKMASHGCVRLTNWDAAALGRAVSKGTPVVFIGVQKPAA